MSAPWRVGRTGWLLDCGDGRRTAGTLAALVASGPAGVVSVRRGARTVLVELATPALARAAGPVLEAMTAPSAPAVPPAVGTAHTLDVVYDGADLQDVAAELGVSADALVAEHTATTWRVEFCGFAPGFAYLAGWARSVARLATPRTRVPAGAVGLAGTWSAAYPADSPGGWRLLGRTDAALWDVARDTPALLVPGDTVRWRAVRGRSGDAAAPPAGELPPPTTTAPVDADVARGLRVLHPGALTLVQDLGRPGFEHLGVSPSGAAHRGAARRANRAVGNAPGAAVLENVGGLEVAAVGDLVVAVAGPDGGTGLHVERLGPAPGPTAPAPGGALVLRAGDRLTVETTGGGRAYLAVRGGLETPEVLGSRSADALGRLAWWPVGAGAVLPVGVPAGVVGAPEPDAPRSGAPVRVVLGPRADRFADPRALLATAWSVGADSNRAGVRLRGAPLPWSSVEELESEPMVPGAIQVPASGLPVVLLRDHPTTGGYPVIAVVVAEDLDRVAGLAPGDALRFTAVPA